MDFQQLEFEDILQQIRKPEKTPEELERIRLEKNAKARAKRAYEKSLIQRAEVKSISKSARHKIKFLYISDIFKSKVQYHWKDRTFSKKVYGLAILTEDNYYYYNEVTVTNNLLNKRQMTRLIMYITSRYQFTKDSVVNISSTLNNNDEPILCFIKILGSGLGFRITKISYTMMLKGINHYYRYVKTSGYTKWMNKKTLRQLLEHDIFVFMPDSDWYAKKDLKQKRYGNSIVECAVAMVYMDIKKHNLEHHDKHLEKVRNNLPIRRMLTKEEKRQKKIEEKRKKIAERKFRKIPERYKIKDEVLGKIEVVNLFKWIEE